MEGAATARRRVLIIVENLPVPFDRRVWQEATTLREAGYAVSVVCPKMLGHRRSREVIDGIHVYRHPLPVEARGALGFAVEYTFALAWEFALAWRVLFERGFDVIHACNPPDTIFLIGGFFKVLLRKKFLFDHHDLNPELYEAKFGRQGLFHSLLRGLEYLTFRTADVSLATNESFREIAIERGRMDSERVFIVRSSPDLDRFRPGEPDPTLRNGRPLLIGYIGIIGKQDGVDLLLHAAHHLVIKRGVRNAQWLVVGDGTELESLRDLARELGIDDWVTFSGYLSGQDLIRALSTFDVGVIPDPPNEYNQKISMNKTFEYLALGIPFVQFDLHEGRRIAGSSAVYAEGDSAVALANSIDDLLQDPARRERMSTLGRERAEANLGWSREAPELLRAYARLWASSP